jgi:hypothetical protein
MIVELHELNCRMIKSGKKLMKKILKNKTPAKPNEIIKTRK